MRVDNAGSVAGQKGYQKHLRINGELFLDEFAAIFWVLPGERGLELLFRGRALVLYTSPPLATPARVAPSPGDRRPP
jgi:hypothetical protein